jgi:hypothetical protein
MPDAPRESFQNRDLYQAFRVKGQARDFALRLGGRLAHLGFELDSTWGYQVTSEGNDPAVAEYRYGLFAPKSRFDLLGFSLFGVSRRQPLLVVTQLSGLQSGESLITIDARNRLSSIRQRAAWVKLVDELKKAVGEVAVSVANEPPADFDFRQAEMSSAMYQAFMRRDVVETKRIAATNLAAVARSPDAEYAADVANNAHVMLYYVALYEADLSGAREHLAAAGRALAGLTVREGTDVWETAIILSFLHLGERQAVLDYVEQDRSRQGPPFRHEKIKWLREGRKLFPIPEASDGDEARLGAWVSDTSVAGDEQAHEVRELFDDGRMQFGVYSQRTTTFRREGPKIVFGDGVEGEFRDGRLTMPATGNAGPSSNLRRVSVVPNAELAGSWAAELSLDGGAKAVMQWTFDSDDDGQCIVGLRTANPQMNCRFTFVSDRLIWADDDGGVVPRLNGDSRKASVTRLAHWCRWSVKDETLTLEGDALGGFVGPGRQTFHRDGDLPSWLDASSP